jgi:hypothetical protein
MMFVASLICTSFVSAAGLDGAPTDSETAFSDVTIPRHMLCVHDPEVLRRNLASYQRIMIGDTIDASGVPVRTDFIYINPSTKDVVIVGVNMKKDTFCITDVFKNVQVLHSEVLDNMESKSSDK